MGRAQAQPDRIRKYPNLTRTRGCVGGLAGPIPFVGGNMIQPVFFVGDDGRVRMLARTGTELLPSGKKARARFNSFLKKRPLFISDKPVT